MSRCYEKGRVANKSSNDAVADVAVSAIFLIGGERSSRVLFLGVEGEVGDERIHLEWCRVVCVGISWEWSALSPHLYTGEEVQRKNREEINLEQKTISKGANGVVISERTGTSTRERFLAMLGDPSMSSRQKTTRVLFFCVQWLWVQPICSHCLSTILVWPLMSSDVLGILPATQVLTYLCRRSSDIKSCQWNKISKVQKLAGNWGVSGW